MSVTSNERGGFIKGYSWLGAAAAISLAGMVGIASAGDAIRVSLHGQGFSATANAASVELVKVRIGGPDGFQDRSQAQGGDVTWRLPAGAPDGVYRYDVYGVQASDGAPDQAAAAQGERASDAYRESGRFRVRGGTVQRPAEGEQEAARGPLGRALAAVLDFVIADARAQDLQASSSVPTVGFEDTNLTGGSNTVWDVLAGENSADCLSNPLGSRLVVEDDIQGNDVIRLCGAGGSGGSVPNARSLVVDDAGDVVLGDGALFLDRSSADLGIGTTSPSGDVHVAGGGLAGNLVISGTTLQLPNPGSGGQVTSVPGEWGLNVDGSGLFLSDNEAGNNGAVKFFNGTPADTLVTNDQGFVGVGTDSPVRALNIVDDGTPNSIPLRLDNPSGNVRFSMASQGTVWTFDNSGGNFRIVKAEGDAAELVVDGDGNMQLNGTLTEGSSRTLKEDIQSVQSQRVLDRLMGLDIAEWRYEGQSGRHMGPMAEEFDAAFGLGEDAQHIAPRDMAAVAMASAQALAKRLEAKEQEIAALREELAAQRDALQSRNAELRQRVDKLAARMARVVRRVEGGHDQLAARQ